MRTLLSLALLLVTAGCSTATYLYSFDITDPGAHNLQKPGERDSLEDADVRAELLVDPTSFQAILLDLTNKTNTPMSVAWNNISIVAPDQTQTPLRPDQPLGPIEPGAKVIARLVTFALPSQGSAAQAFDNSQFELVVPMVVRNNPREYRYHLRATLQKL